MLRAKSEPMVASSLAEVVSTSRSIPQRQSSIAGTSVAAVDFSDPGNSDDSSNYIGSSDFSSDEVGI